MANLSDADKVRLETIKVHFDTILTQAGAAGVTIQAAVNSIKYVMDQSILELGEDGKTALIRSQKLIKMIHEAVKGAFIQNGVNSNLIKPELGISAGELQLGMRIK